MNEAETRAELIDPQLKASGWGVVEDTKILREYNITAGRIQMGGKRAKPVIADYVLVYKGVAPDVPGRGYPCPGPIRKLVRRGRAFQQGASRPATG